MGEECVTRESRADEHSSVTIAVFPTMKLRVGGDSYLRGSPLSYPLAQKYTAFGDSECSSEDGELTGEID